MNIAFSTRGGGLWILEGPTFQRLLRRATSQRMEKFKRLVQILVFCLFLGEKKSKKKRKKKVARGRAGIEPATSPTRRENHTSRPTALIGDDRRAFNEDRTRDLVLTKHMLCQLSYGGEIPALRRFQCGFHYKSGRKK